LLEKNEQDMPVLPDPIQTEEYIPDEGSPSQFLQLENFEGLVLITLSILYMLNHSCLSLCRFNLCNLHVLLEERLIVYTQRRIEFP